MASTRTLAAIGAGGALGGAARYLIEQAMPADRDAFPWATFVINVSGSLALALLLVFVLEIWPPTRYVRPFAAIGFLGAYTTFSTWMVETAELVAHGRARPRRGLPRRQRAGRPGGGVARPRPRPGGCSRPAHGRARASARPEGADMRLQGPSQRLTIFIGETDHYHRRPLYSEIVRRAHDAGLAGASVFRGIEGFGASSRIHTTRILSLSEDLPLAIIIVDTPENIAAFLPELDELITEGLVILDDVQVVKYVGRGHENAPSGVG